MLGSASPQRGSNSRWAELCRQNVAHAGRATARAGFPALKPVFILRADRTVSELVLPQLHTVVEFVLPSAVAVLSHPDLRRPIGQESIDGIATTQYLVENDSPEGRATGSLWLSRDGIPMKCVGKFETRNGKLSTIDWQLHHVKIGRQDAALFEVPRYYTKLPLEAHGHRARSGPVIAFVEARARRPSGPRSTMTSRRGRPATSRTPRRIRLHRRERQR